MSSALDVLRCSIFKFGMLKFCACMLSELYRCLKGRCLSGLCIDIVSNFNLFLWFLKTIIISVIQQMSFAVDCAVRAHTISDNGIRTEYNWNPQYNAGFPCSLRTLLIVFRSHDEALLLHVIKRAPDVLLVSYGRFGRPVHTTVVVRGEMALREKRPETARQRGFSRRRRKFPFPSPSCDFKTNVFRNRVCFPTSSK